MTTEQFFPTHFITRGVDRETLASHIENLRKVDRLLSRLFMYRAYWVGVVPASPARMFWRYGLLPKERTRSMEW